MANLRTFYACQAIQLAGPTGSDNGNIGSVTSKTKATLDGVQSLGVTTNYNLEPVYQLGRLQAGDQYENNPEVEVTFTQAMTEKLDAWSYLMGEGTLSARQDARGELHILMYPDSGVADGLQTANITIRPAYLQSATFNFPTDGNFTADYTVVGNSKTYNTAATLDARPASELTGVRRRNSVSSQSVFTSRNGVSGALPHGAKIQNVTISVDLGREEIYELGSQLPFTRYINFPVEVSTEIEVIAASGDKAAIVEASAICANEKNVGDQQIVVELCGGAIFDCGKKNRLQSVTQAGGDAGGDNVTYTYSYINYSEFAYGIDGEQVFNQAPFEQVDLDNYDAFSQTNY